MKKKRGPAPYLRKDREHESNIGVFRVERGLTIKETCLMAGMFDYEFISLQNGMSSPFYLKDGRVKPCVERLLKIFNCTMGEAFPRYVCEMKKNTLPDDVASELLLGEYSISTAGGKTGKNEMADDYKNVIKKALDSLPKETRAAVILYFGLFDVPPMSQKEIAEKIGRSKARVSLHVRKGLRHLSRFRSLRELHELSTEEKTSQLLFLP